MQIMLIGLKVVFWMVLIPYCCGIPLASGFGKFGRSTPMTMLSGYLLVLSVFQVYYLFFVLFYNHFTPLVWVSGISYIVIAVVASVLKGKYHLGGRRAGKSKKDSLERVFWIVFIILFLYQISMTLLFYYPDGDDSFYAVTSVITATNDNMYINLPYTGETSSLDKRHAFSSAPIFIAFLGKVCGIHPIIVSNIFFSIAVMVLVYMIYYLIAFLLLEENKEYIPLFLITICILYLFGNNTVYQDTTFLMTRTGQGKALLSNIVPASAILGLLLLSASVDKKNIVKSETAVWILMSQVIMIAGCTSTMGMFLGPFIVGGGVLLLAIFYKRPQMLLKLIFAMLPILFCGGLYLLVAYF